MKKLYVMIFPAALAFLFSCATAAVNTKETDAYLKANAAYDKMDIAGALSGYNEFITEFPQSKYVPDALLKMAALTDSVDGADKIYRQVIALAPGTGSEDEALIGLGKMYYASGDYKRALDFFTQSYEKFPDMAGAEEAGYHMMLCMYAEKDYDGLDSAFAAFWKKGYLKFKMRAQALYADSLYARGNYAQAAKIYSDITASTAENSAGIYMPEVYFKFSDSLKKSGDEKGAAGVFSELKEKFPASPEAKGGAQAAVDAAAAEPEPEKALPAGNYSVQVGAYTNRRFCDMWEKKLNGANYETYVKKDGKFFKLSVGSFATKEGAQMMKEELKAKQNMGGFIVKF
jgi:TolA-binding protein